MSLGSIQALLADRIGLDADSLGPRLIEHALKRRCRALGVQGHAAYLERLRAEPEELQELVEELVVPETWFFRDERPFELLARHVGHWSPTETVGPLRLLSVPCATGEEPYSMAIALLERGWPSAAIRIDAFDISERVIVRARRGVFDARACRTLPATVRSLYFVPQADGLEVRKEVRDLVRFERGNLFDAPTLAGRPQYDAIFCRNLLIYLNPAARARAVEMVTRLLRPGGMLCLGHAEARPDGLTGFEPMDGPAGLAYRKRTSGEAGRTSSLDLGRLEKTLPKVSRPHPPDAPRAPGRGRSPSLVPVPLPAAQPAVGVPESPDSLEQATILANAREYARAIEVCEGYLRNSGPSPQAFHLLGMIHQAAGSLDRAEECLGRVVYLDGDHEEALLALSLLASRRGDRVASDRYRRQAERAHSRKAGR